MITLNILGKVIIYYASYVEMCGGFGETYLIDGKHFGPNSTLRFSIANIPIFLQPKTLAGSDLTVVILIRSF